MGINKTYIIRKILISGGGIAELTVALLLKRTGYQTIVIVGPTAVGKSDLAVEIARKFNGEVISADSRQVYKGLDIGSGKITKKEMKGVPHYLLDVANPKRARYTASDFARDAKSAADKIRARGKLPIICGGTGFYIDAMLSNLPFADVPPNPKLRKKLSKIPAEKLYKILLKKDSRRAREIDPHNKMRLIRALEIIAKLGKVPKKHSHILENMRMLWIGLDVPRKTLKERIKARLDKRIRQGMIEEVKRLHKHGVSWKRLYDFGLEYRYVSLYLQKKLTLDEMKEKLATEINQYAKRQMTWFKRNKTIKWFSPKDVGKIREIVSNFLKL